ncbi:DUF5794 domain-containing protein [Halospeciosus flavus]|uniref:DUF5794 domain-containing protein n=1 Tax=Halospeciosus flavus TaxID=3032283 RepID=A0ABD5Z372_9EURY|nr:DUF5794 domain-containing protein [Halospeciosus flavus]
MSSSQHPVALRLEQRVGGATRLLATVMLLPLVDGIFPALVIAGALDSVAGIVQVGLLVFGGSATVAVILAEMGDTSTRQQFRSVLLVGVPLIILAVVEAALAPTIASVLDVHIFERFAAIVILAIAAKTASATIGEYIPGPAVVVGLGAVASLTLSNPTLVVQTNPTLMLHAAAAALVGVGFALGVVAFQPYLRRIIDIDRFRFGSAVALGTLAISLFGIVPTYVPLPVFVVAGILAIDPDAAGNLDETTTDDASPDGAATDGGAEDDADDVDPSPSISVDGTIDYERDSGSRGETAYGYPGEDQGDERAPWL